MERHPQNGKKYLQITLSGKGLVSRLHENHLQLNTKRQIAQLKNEPKL